jgi:hypothetical protein
MLELDGINFWAVVAAWIVNCAVGAYWYSPAGFAKQWKKHTGVDLLKIPQKEATRILMAVVVSGAVQAFTLALVLNSLDVSTATEGLVAGLVLWFGLVAATTVGVTLYARKSWRFLWLNSSYFLIVMAVNSVLLAVWR